MRSAAFGGNHNATRMPGGNTQCDVRTRCLGGQGRQPNGRGCLRANPNATCDALPRGNPNATRLPLGENPNADVRRAASGQP
eukprot:gene6911-30889_t